MPGEFYHQSFNVGVVDRDKLHRVDLQRMRLAAETQTNIWSDAVGKGFLRPGTQFCSATKSSNAGNLIPFIAGADAAYVLEFTASVLRVRDSDGLLITRPSVTSTVTNGDFSSATGWTITNSAAADSDINSTASGALWLRAYGIGATTSVKQQVSTSSAGTEHALRITVTRGRCVFRCGSTDGDDDYISTTILEKGVHSLAFVPSGSYWIKFSDVGDHVACVVDGVTVEAAGAIELATVWDADALSLIRTDQSLDVMFVACDGYPQQKIERRGDGASAGRSWSVVYYRPDDGPFLAVPSANVKLTPAAIAAGTVTTLTASGAFFKAGHVGALFKLTHAGQKTQAYLAAQGAHTKVFEVTGINETEYNERNWTWTISGTWVGTIRVERSFDGEDVGFTEFRSVTGSSTVDITANASNQTNDDNEDNTIAWYRFTMSAYTSGTPLIDTTYDGGGDYGICRVVSVDSATQATVDVIRPFANTTATDDWQEGMWSDVQGWPAAVAFVEGRLSWSGADHVDVSISDAYAAFDETYVGDAGPLSRSIGVGGRTDARWALNMSSLIVGANSQVVEITASVLDDLLTPTSYKVRNLSGPIGCVAVNAVKLAGDRAVFVEAAGNSLYEITRPGDNARFSSAELSKLTTDVFSAGITKLAVQNRPDQRIWVVVDGADAVLYLYEPLLEVVAALPVSMSDDDYDDVIESVCVIPGTGQDRVFVIVKRTVDGATVRYVERFAKDNEAVPQSICKCVDSHVVFGAGSATITGLGHLEGRTVVAWADGAPVNETGTTTTKEFVVTGGAITLPSVPATGGVVGIKYRGRYKSGRLAYGTGNTTAMLKNKTLARAGILLGDYCRSGVRYGTSFSSLFSLPVKNAKGTTATEVVSGPDEDEEVHALDGEIGFDTRLCIELYAPKPATILGIVMQVEAKGG